MRRSMARSLVTKANAGPCTIRCCRRVSRLRDAKRIANRAIRRAALRELRRELQEINDSL